MKIRLSFIAVLVLFYCISVRAQQPEVPDTPAGKRLREMLAIIETSDPERVLAFVRAFDPSFRDGFPEEEHIGVFRQLHEEAGGLEVVEVTDSEPYELAVVAKGKKSAQLMRVQIATSSTEPYAITDIGIRLANAPDGAARLPSTVPEIPDKEATLKRVDEFLSRLQPLGFNGGVLIAQNGQVIFENYFGLANRAEKIPLTRDTVFDIASATKDFTHTAILQLVAKGKISLEDPISKYFADAPSDKAEITIRNLVEHTAGFADHSGKDEEVISREEFLGRVFGTKLLFEPGRRESYSNPGYSLLAAIIEKVSGLSYEEYLKRNIFAPAGMTQTGYALPKWKPGQIAHTYGGGQDRGSTFDFPHPKDGPYWNLRGNGGTLSTLRDMFTFYEASVNGKLLPADSKLRIFAPDQLVMLAGSDRFHFFLYYRDPQAGITTIIATTDPAVKAPFVNQQIVAILNGNEPKMP